jgi:hypothetical protein
LHNTVWAYFHPAVLRVVFNHKAVTGAAGVVLTLGAEGLYSRLPVALPGFAKPMHYKRLVPILLCRKSAGLFNIHGESASGVII